MSPASVEKLKKYLPENSVLEEVLQVKVNSRVARERVIRNGRFALITPFIDEYEVDEWEPIPPYLCIVSFVFSHSPAEVLESLHGKPFGAATIGRLLDLRRAHPKKRFGYRIIAFLGSSCYLGLGVGMSGYSCLGETSGGAWLLLSPLDRGWFKFKMGWRYALQPDSEEVAELIKEIVEIQRAGQPVLA